VATLIGKREELAEVMKMRDLCIVALAETRISGRIIHENYRLMYSGGEDGRYLVHVLVSDTMAPYVEKLNFQ